MSEQQKAEFAAISQSVASHLQEQAAKLFEIVSEKASVFTKLDEPIRTELGQLLGTVVAAFAWGMRSPNVIRAMPSVADAELIFISNYLANYLFWTLR
jgi:hypothetical protein